MAETVPIPHPEERFAEIGQSRFCQFGTDVHLAGDPETPEDFARAQGYLETITAHLIEFGPVWEKKPQDIVYELDYHNAYHRQEVEQERRGGDRAAEYREINLKQLQAFSKRRVLAFEDSGWEVTQAYRIVNFIDTLIEQAVTEQEEIEQRMAGATPEHPAVLQPSNDRFEDLPF